MWHKEYRDYKTDQTMVKQQVEPGRGIVGCEMHEINGWGNTLQHSLKKPHGFFASWLIYLFGKEENHDAKG